MKVYWSVVLVALSLLPINSLMVSGHFMPGTVTHDTTFSIKENSLVVHYNIFLRNTDLDNYYQTIDKDNNKQISNKERANYAKLIGESFFCTINNQKVVPKQIQNFPEYNSIDKEQLYPQIAFDINFGSPAINTNKSEFNCVNQYQIPSSMPQMWEMLIDTDVIKVENYRILDQHTVTGKLATYSDLAIQTSSSESDKTKSNNFGFSNIVFVIFGLVVCRLLYIFLEYIFKKEK